MNCEICGKEDLFSAVAQEGTCAACTLRFGIPCGPGFAEMRRTKIEAAKVLLAKTGTDEPPNLEAIRRRIGR